MKFIAFCVGNNQNSGPKDSHKDCVDWASKKLGENHGILEVKICTITSTVERSASPVRVTHHDEFGDLADAAE